MRSVLTRYEAGIDLLASRERDLWLLAVLGYGIGDLGTTLVGLSTGRGAEAGPVAAELVAGFGLLGLFVLKLATFGTFYLSWRLVSPTIRVAVPLAVAIVGLLVTGWNVLVLL